MRTGTSQIRPPIKNLDVRTLKLSEPVNVQELERVLIKLTDKLNEVINRLNIP